jgi:hypothetical protein
MNGVMVIVQNSDGSVCGLFRAPKGISLQQVEADVQYSSGFDKPDDIMTELGYESLMYLTVTKD